MNNIPVRDGLAEPGDRLYFVAASGRRITLFTLLRADRCPWPNDAEEVVVAAEKADGQRGIYDPLSCFIDIRFAEAHAARILAREKADAERVLASLEGVKFTPAELTEMGTP